MATKHSRLNVTLSPGIAHIVKLMAKKHDKSLSAVASELIENAIEFDEDAYWSMLAEEREKTSKKMINHDEFWAKALRD